MYAPSEITLVAQPIQLDDVDLDASYTGRKDCYQKTLNKLQKQLLKVQQAYYHQGKRAIIVIEGWDASGKGGLIRRITEKLDPRGFRVYPIAAPSSEEQGRHYLYRFQRALPPPGRIAIFDRSYYGRVLVERIKGLATPTQWQRAFQEINEFERLLTDDDVRIIKLFIHISPQEQLKRFAERLDNPYKRWKLTEEDIRNREKWPQYEAAINDMFSRTSTVNARWQVISGEHKWFARMQGVELLVKSMSEGVDITPPPLDQSVVRLAKDKLGIG